MDTDDVRARIQAVEYEIAQLKAIIGQRPTTQTVVDFFDDFTYGQPGTPSYESATAQTEGA